MANHHEKVSAQNVQVVNSTTITAQTGAAVAGTGSVDVTTTNGTNTPNSLYTYTLNGISPPTNGNACSTWGFCTMSFDEEWNDLLSVYLNDATHPALPGYNWYTQSFGWQNTHYIGGFQDWKDGGFPLNPIQYYLPQYFSVSSGILTMIGHVDPQPDTNAELHTAAFVNNAQGYNGTVINSTNGWYTEVRAKNTGPTSGQGNAYWAVDNDAPAGTNTTTYIELDFLEVSSSTTINMSALQWNAPDSLLNGPTQAGFTLDTNFHVYGCLFVPPARNGGTGLLHFFIDGVLHSENSVPIPNGAIGTTLANQHLQLILLTNSNSNTNPFQIDYVRVWQMTPNG